MNPAKPCPETELFVVHVWRQHTRFRASVRRVDREETQLFTTAAQLARYLSSVCAETGCEIASPDSKTPDGLGAKPSR